VAVLPKTISWWKRHYHEASLDRPLLWLMALFVDATPSMISGTIQRLQLSTGHARALEWAGVKTSRIAGRLASDALLRPSQVYRLLSRLPNEALAMVLAKGLATARGVAAGRLTGRIQRFLTRDRRATTTINGETLKRLGLEPGPHFKKVLERLLNERLDGRITAATQERDRARRLVERYR
jgi:tRNA nucleotidyltransferase (CCA-adding enzyme)